MNKQEIQEKLGIKDSTFNEEYHNPLRLAISEEFNKRGSTNYRDRAIDRVMKARINFTSEPNSMYNLVEKLVKIVSPETSETLTPKSGGGNNDSLTFTFKDSIGNEYHLTIPNDGLSVKFAEKK